jgi:hypothetical protein
MILDDICSNGFFVRKADIAGKKKVVNPQKIDLQVLEVVRPADGTRRCCRHE